MRRAKSLRIGVHHADTFVREPVYGTRLRLLELLHGVHLAVALVSHEAHLPERASADDRQRFEVVDADLRALQTRELALLLLELVYRDRGIFPAVERVRFRRGAAFHARGERLGLVLVQVFDVRLRRGDLLLRLRRRRLRAGDAAAHRGGGGDGGGVGWTGCRV
eukprot:31124-Pelagococcus_subviridis.AAC.5